VFPDFHRLAAVLGRITHKADIIDTGTASWRFRHGLSVNDATSMIPTGKCARDNRHKSLRAALGLRVDGHRNYSPPHDRKTQREVVPFPASPPGRVKCRRLLRASGASALHTAPATSARHYKSRLGAAVTPTSPCLSAVSRSTICR
jgi:hypothetical protein